MRARFVILVAGLALSAACDAKSDSVASGPANEPVAAEPAEQTKPAKPIPRSDFQTFPTAAAAVQSLLSRRPRVVGFGEYHSTVGGPAVTPSLTRFRTEILPSIAGALDGIVVETWVEPSGCGKAAVKASKKVKDVMQRPEQTETEVFTLLREARERKLKTEILEVSCADYESFLSADKLDYDKPLSIVTARLLAAIEKAAASESLAATAVYGGTMHNDVHPTKGFGAYSYAPRVTELTGGKYLEIDLFVPELIASSTLFVGQPWFEIAKREASADHVVVIPRGKSSFAVVLRKDVTPTPPK